LVRDVITLVVADPWWTYGLDFVVAFMAGIAADRLMLWRMRKRG
jgi:hypothetical protein